MRPADPQKQFSDGQLPRSAVRRASLLMTKISFPRKRPTTSCGSPQVIVFARDVGDLGDLPAQPGWKRLDPDSHVAPGTDDYADILERKLGR
jgi:hypothetical protein